MAEFKVALLSLACCIINAIGDSSSRTITVVNSTTINSPNYPKNYPPNTTVTWMLRGNDGVGTWELFFTEDIKLEQSKTCVKDYLEINENNDPKRLCGHIQDFPPHKSKTPELKITFKSDGNVQDKGFKIRVIHVIDHQDIKKLKEMGDGLEAKKANVIHNYNDEPDTHQKTIYIILVAVLAVAVLVFVVLLICLLIGVYNKRRQRYRTNPKSVIKHIQFAAPQPASNLQMPRRYSRPGSLSERQDTNPLPSTHKSITSSRGPLMSTGSIRYS